MTAWRHLLTDSRQAIRGFRLRPGFTVAAMLTLGLGIGATTTLLSVVDTLMFRPPVGVREPGRLVRPYFHFFQEPFGGWTGNAVSYPDFIDLRDRVPAFERVAAYHAANASLGRGREARPVDVYGVSGDYFALLGARAARGRLIVSSDDSPGAPAYTAVLSHGFWRQSFGGDEGILGRTVHLGADQFTIIGVTEPGFAGAELTGPDLWVSLAPLAARFEGGDYTAERGAFFLGTIARLRPGVSPETAAAQATSAIAAGRADPRVANGFRHVVLGPVQEARGPEAGRDVSVTLWLSAVSLLVLLVACANVGNLLLHRGLARTRELAIRRVMGATHGRLIQQLVIESLLLGALGGGAAALLALWAGAAVRGLLLPPAAAAAFSLDARVFALTAIASVTAGIIAGIAPAWRHARGDLTPALKQGSGGAGYRRSRLRDGLVVAQIAFSVVLVVGAGLFVRSLRNALTMDLGLEPSRVVVLSANLHGVGYGEAEARQAFSAMREAVIRHPEVESASLSVGAPFGWSFGASARLPGRDSVPRLPSGGPYYQAVEPEYRQTVGLALVRGRDFTPADRRGATKVALVSQQTARLYWPNGDELGQCLILGDDDCREVVGVVEDGRRNEILEPPQLMVYLPIDQQDFGRFHLSLLVRTRGDPRPVATVLRELAQAAYPGLPFVRAQAMQDVIAPQYDGWRMGATVFGLFGALALTLATIGVYSTMAYAVRGRIRELGIRLALGASASGLAGMVVRDGLRPVAIGLGIGTVAALFGSRAVASLLYGVGFTDPVILGGTAMLLALAGALACVIPARRAARVDPVTVLQSE
jgi:predicted permease